MVLANQSHAHLGICISSLCFNWCSPGRIPRITWATFATRGLTHSAPQVAMSCKGWAGAWQGSHQALSSARATWGPHTLPGLGGGIVTTLYHQLPSEWAQHILLTMSGPMEHLRNMKSLCICLCAYNFYCSDTGGFPLLAFFHLNSNCDFLWLRQITDY
jgi:hypothetical protein